MAVYVDLACTKAAFVKDTTPSTNYHGAAKYQLAGAQASTSYRGNRLLLEFEQLQGEARYRSILGMTFEFFVNVDVSSPPGLYFAALDAAFDENSVTWDTQPNVAKSFYKGTSPSIGGSGDEHLSIMPYSNSAQNDWPAASVFALRSPAFYLTASGVISHGDKYVDAYSKAAAEGKRPYLHVSLSDSFAYVKPQLQAPALLEVFDVSKPVTFSWTNDFLRRGESGFVEPFAPIVQTGGTIYWRESSSEGAFTAVPFTGSEPSYTFPANYFPAQNITWYVVPTYEVYDSHQSDWRTACPRIVVDMAATGLAGVHLRNDPNTTYPWTGSYNLWRFVDSPFPNDYWNLLFSAANFPSQYNYNAIADAGLCFGTYIDAGKSQAFGYYKLVSGFDPSTVTWNTKPGNDGTEAGIGSYDNRSGTSTASITDLFAGANGASSADKSRNALSILQSPGFMLQTHTSTPPDYDDGSSHFTVRDPVRRRALLLDQTVTSKPAATTNASGYVNPHVAQVFRWQHVPDGDYWCVAGWTTASATLYWRQTGASTWNSVAAAAGSSEVILAAETLPAGSVEWYVSATDDQGTTASSEIYTISTADTLHTATPVYPIDTTENGDAGIRFIWTDTSDTGAAPSGADLQYSADQGATWTDFASPRTSATQYDAPGGGFPPGVLLWRVRSLNAEGTAGPWSAPVSFLCFAAPDPPILDSDGKPFLTVTWQSSGQRAYRVTIDGKAYGPYFGDGKTFQTPEYLSDGSHVVRVEIQNEYGLWNGAEITVTVANVPGQPVILSGSFDRDAALRWTCEDATADFLIYRDDVQIGHTSGYSFADRTVLDFHTWRVINRLPGGYYTASNTVSGTLCTEGMALALLSGGPWIDLTLSTNAIRTTTAAAGRSVVLRQFAGREYPDAEAAPYKTLQISFDVSWTPAQAAQARAFEGLIGAAVIFKEPGEEAFVGVLSAFQRSHSFPARSYTATVQRIHWREYVDADS